MSVDWDVTVVGADIAGLTAARAAAERGLRVVAYDRMTPGGQLVNLTTLHDHPGGSTCPGSGRRAGRRRRTDAAGVTGCR